ncbi:methylated-DNA-- -cysteine methyltransferase [Brachionus plicatilis]|uniref:Methylated-DNA--protein-cysteine methyltransferase n=1 Tax=Brachionus plicatilis TaxID=10195 RepID=A0A3M7S4P8_BRAPC|nr:methylated-DNA-- -cysteine methyltransferase [Brachionus plicatilis]
MKNCDGKPKNFTISIPIGLLSVISCENGLHSIKFQHFDANYNHEVKVLDENPTIPLAELENYLQKYFLKMPLTNLEDFICWSKVCKRGSFSESVLKKLLKIRFSEKITYKNLALLSGNANSQRAVGSVMRKNPICLVIPCHRVVNANNKIGNYTGGVEIKKWLLEFEKLE